MADHLSPFPSPEAFPPAVVVPQCGSHRRNQSPPHLTVQDIGRTPDATYDIVKKSGLFAKGVSYDNNVPKGTEPTLRDTFGQAGVETLGPRRGGGEYRPAYRPEGEGPAAPAILPEVTPAPAPREAPVVERPAPYG